VLQPQPPAAARVILEVEPLEPPVHRPRPEAKRERLERLFAGTGLEPRRERHDGGASARVRRRDGEFGSGRGAGGLAGRRHLLGKGLSDAQGESTDLERPRRDVACPTRQVLTARRRREIPPLGFAGP
jgi:hypothetical protein